MPNRAKYRKVQGRGGVSMIYDHDHSFEWNCGAESRDDEVKKLSTRVSYLEAILETTQKYLRDLELDYDEMEAKSGSYGGS